MSNTGALDSFVAAFNQRDLAALKALLATDATAEVLGSGFGTERGPDDIGKKSLTHMLSDENPLIAEHFALHGQTYVLFLNADKQLDTAATIQSATGKITRIEYLVTWFRADSLKPLAAARGIQIAQ
ncbi:MAG: hypothetical protein IT462_09420 [Planctomycetes bacterium]|nr:hypothetical protein [Planctomycetota bacterium]